MMVWFTFLHISACEMWSLYGAEKQSMSKLEATNVLLLNVKNVGNNCASEINAQV